MNMVKNIIKVLIASLLVPIFIMMLVLAVYEYKSTTKIYNSSMSMIVHRVNSSVQQYFDSMNEKVQTNVDTSAYETLFNDQTNPELRAQIEAEFAKMKAYSNFIENTVMTNNVGKTIAGDIRDVTPYVDDSKFERARKEMVPVIDTDFIYLDNRVVFTIYYPLSFQGRNTNAMLVQWINAAFIESMITSAGNQNSENIFIIDANSNVIGYKDDGKITNLSGFNNSDGLMHNMQNMLSWETEKMHSINYKDENGVKKEALFWRNSKYDIMVVCEKNHSEIQHSAMVITIIISVFTALIMVMGIGCFIKMRRKIQAPLDEALTTMQEYENGNFSYRPVISGDDEMSNITVSLWNMAMRVSDMYDEVRENEHCYKKSMEFASDMLTDYTISKNKYVADKEKWIEMFGFEFVGNEKQMNTEIMNRLHEEDKKQFKAYRDKIFADIYDNLEKQMQIEFRMKLKDGEYHWILRRDILVKGKTDNIEHILGSYAIIDDRKKNEIELSSKAHYDQLTKIYNRATFMAKAKEWMRSNENKDCSMIFVDADNFKYVNDTYGHEAGDDVIRYIADTIKMAVGDNGICGRYGGDEFIAFVYDKSKAIMVAEYIIENLPKDFQVPSQEDVVLSMHSSVGVAHYPDHAYDVENLLKRADEAMYVSKKSGKDRYTVFDNSIELV